MSGWQIATYVLTVTTCVAAMYAYMEREIANEAMSKWVEAEVRANKAESEVDDMRFDTELISQELRSISDRIMAAPPAEDEA